MAVFLWSLVSVGVVYGEQGGIQPIVPQSNVTSPLSPESAANTPPDGVKYAPYNDGYIELDLWRIEERKFVRSRPVVSPNRNQMAYSEVTYMPDTRQTFTKLFLVNLDPVGVTSNPPVQNPPQQPKKKKKRRKKKGDDFEPLTTSFEQRFNPDRYLKSRQMLVGLGSEKTVPFEFRTFTIIDWSSTGQRLLFKQKRGVLHVGLRTSDILIYDRTRGTVTIYPEIQRALEHYWDSKGEIPLLDTIAWDIFPLGFEPESDSQILFKGWAFDKKNKKFLGIWRYDIDAERAELLSLEDSVVPVAANGVIVVPRVEGKKPR